MNISFINFYQRKGKKMRNKLTHLFLALLMPLSVVFSDISNVNAQEEQERRKRYRTTSASGFQQLSSDNHLCLSDSLFLTNDEIVQYDNHYFTKSSDQYEGAKKEFEEGTQQSWSRHAYIAGIAKMYEATLDPKYLCKFGEFVKLIYDKRSDKLKPPLGDQVRGTVNTPKIAKAWVAYEKSYGGGTDVMAALGNQLYTVQNSRLHKVNLGDPGWEVLPNQRGNEAVWGSAEAMVALGNYLYIVQNSRLYKVDSGNGLWEVLSDQNGKEVVWGGTGSMAALGNYLYIVQNSRLYKVDPGNGLWEVLSDQNGKEAVWGGAEAMVALGNYLYIVQNSRMHKVNSWNGNYVVLSDQNGKEAVWGGTGSMAALGNYLYIVQNSRLHKVNSWNGNYVVLSDQNGKEAVWGGTEAMVALGNYLYIAQNSRWHKVDLGGHYVVLLDQGRYTAQIHETGMYCELILWYSRIVMEEPALHVKYGDEAVKFAYGAMEAIHEFNADRENDYYILPKELVPLICEDPPTNQCEAGKPLVYNVGHLMLRALIELTRVIHSDYYQASSYSSVLEGTDYRDLAPKIIERHQAYFKEKDWKYLETEESIKYLVWPRYPDNWYFKNDDKYVTDDVPHASVSIEYLLKLYENQGFLNSLLTTSGNSSYIQVTLEDIKRIANTFLYKIDENPYDCEGIFFNAQMYGEPLPYIPCDNETDWLDNGGITGWLQLSLRDESVFTECAKTALWVNLDPCPPDYYDQPFMEDGGDAYFAYILKEKNDRYKNILGLRVIVWVNSYLLEHARQDFKT